MLDSNFYLENIIVGETYLPPDESAHIVKSFRAKSGDRLTLCDGRGNFARALILEAHFDNCRVLIENIEHVGEQIAPPLLHLAIACQKNGEEEDIVFHAAQLPLAAIHLIRTERSLEPKNSNLSKLCRRLNAKSIAALKQSCKPYLTTIEPPVKFNDFLEEWHKNIIVCDINGNAGVPDINSPTAILCGPEGGFTSNEMKLLNEKNAYFLSLGHTRLRAVTAPLFALGKVIS